MLKRTQNFSVEERSLLLDLVDRYRSLIENKRTDACTNATKEEGWRQLTTEFNSSSGAGVCRSVDQLRTCWKGIKRTTKQNLATEKISLHKTGGGPPEASKVTEFDQRVVSTFTSQFVPLENPFDDDAVFDASKMTDSQSTGYLQTVDPNVVLLLAPELHTSSCTATSTTTATIESLSSLVVHNTQATPSTSTAVEPPVGAAIKRRGFFASTSATSNKRANKLSASDTHKQFGAMAEIKATQLKEQSTMLRVRDERDQLLHDLQLQKLQLEIEALKARERRQSELHQVDMDMKRAQLRLLKKQSDEE